MAKLVFENTDDEVELEDGSKIAQACEDAGVPFACTDGYCGTCIAEFEGVENLSDPSAAEIDFLGEEGCKKERMCCQSTIKSGTVKIRF